MRDDPNAIATFGAVAREIGGGAVSVLDLGCGSGELLTVLQRQGVGDLTGVGWDIAVPAGVVAINGVDFGRADWTAKLGGRTFDVVVATDVIEHLCNPYQFLADALALVHGRGRLILTFPNVHNLRSIVGYALAGRFSGFFGPNFTDGHPLFDQHIFVPNLHLLRYFLRLTGFAPPTLQYVYGPGRLFSQTTLLVTRPVPRP